MDSEAPEVVAVDPREKEVREWTTADWYIARFYWSVTRKSKNYPYSVLDMIRHAPTKAELDSLVENAWPGASSGTRRKWARAAAERYKQLG